MKLLAPLYETSLKWEKHKHAEKYLAGLSCADSAFFPVPSDVILAPMLLGQVDKACRFALVTTIASVMGGMLGYISGYYAFESFIEPMVLDSGHEKKLILAQQ